MHLSMHPLLFYGNKETSFHKVAFLTILRIFAKITLKNNTMKKMMIPVLAAALLLSCQSHKQQHGVASEATSNETVLTDSAKAMYNHYAKWFAESEMKRFPEAWQLDHGKRLFFGYA